MIRVLPLDADHQAAWDRYVLHHPDSHFAMTTPWRSLIASHFGVAAAWRVALRDGRVCGTLPLFLRRGRGFSGFTAPGGLVADDEAVAKALVAEFEPAVAGAHGGMLELRDQARAWPGLVTNEEHITLVLDLADTVEEQWRGIGPKVRNQVRKAENAGLRCAWGEEHVAAFHRVFSENMRDLGTPAMEVGYFEAALRLFGGRAQALVIYLGDKPVGGMFLVHHGDSVFDPWASSLREYFALCPNNLLYWEAIRAATEAGRRRFDFGRSQPGSGTARFKEQWGATPRPLYYQYLLGSGAVMPTLERQKSSLDLAVRAWKRLPLAVARRLGPMVRRKFPEAL